MWHVWTFQTYIRILAHGVLQFPESPGFVHSRMTTTAARIVLLDCHRALLLLGFGPLPDGARLPYLPDRYSQKK